MRTVSILLAVVSVATGAVLCCIPPDVSGPGHASMASEGAHCHAASKAMPDAHPSGDHEALPCCSSHTMAAFLTDGSKVTPTVIGAFPVVGLTSVGTGLELHVSQRTRVDSFLPPPGVHPPRTFSSVLLI